MKMHMHMCPINLSGKSENYVLCKFIVSQIKNYTFYKGIIRGKLISIITLLVRTTLLLLVIK